MMLRVHVLCLTTSYFMQIRPGEIVDKILEFAIDIMTPGGGVGESSW